MTIIVEGYYLPRCPECKRRALYPRLRTGDFRCKSCGYEGPAMIQSKTEIDESPDDKGTSVTA